MGAKEIVARWRIDGRGRGRSGQRGRALDENALDVALQSFGARRRIRCECEIYLLGERGGQVGHRSWSAFGGKLMAAEQKLHVQVVKIVSARIVATLNASR